MVVTYPFSFTTVSSPLYVMLTSSFVLRMKNEGAPLAETFTLMSQPPALMRPSERISGSFAGYFKACVLIIVAKRYTFAFSDFAVKCQWFGYFLNFPLSSARSQLTGGTKRIGLQGSGREDVSIRCATPSRQALHMHKARIGSIYRHRLCRSMQHKGIISRF